MRKKVLAIVLIAIVTPLILLSIGIWFVQNRTNQPPNQVAWIPHVNITAFSWQWGIFPVVGLTVVNTFNVTVQNNDVVNVSGLTLTVRLFKNESEVREAMVTNVDALQAGDSREILGYFFSAFGNNDLDGAVCDITLAIGDVVLDRLKREI